MKFVVVIGMCCIMFISCTMLKAKTQVNINHLRFYSVIRNAHGNAMIHIAQLFVIPCANRPSVIRHVLNPKTQFAMWNVRNQNARSNALIKDVKQLIARNVLLCVNNHIVLRIVKHQNPNVNLYVKNRNVIGNVINHNAQNRNVSWFVKIQIAHHRLNVVHVRMECLLLVSRFRFLRKRRGIRSVVSVHIKYNTEII